MIVVIDAGNTRTKWAIFDLSGAIIATGYHLTAELEAWTAPAIWQTCNQAIISNVAGDSVFSILYAQCEQYDLKIRSVTVEAQALGVINQYETPHLLGADRWLAMIATKHIYGAPAVIISAGTAVTVDALSLNDSNAATFSGGFILPSIHLMTGSLVNNTALLGMQPGELKQFPLSTKDCIYSGAMHAVIGAVRFMLENLRAKHHQEPVCVVTGGDAKIISEGLQQLGVVDNERLYVSADLVFRGLFLLKESA